MCVCCFGVLIFECRTVVNFIYAFPLKNYYYYYILVENYFIGLLFSVLHIWYFLCSKYLLKHQKKLWDLCWEEFNDLWRKKINMVEAKYQGHFEEQKKCVLFCVFCVWQHTNSKKIYNLIDCAFHLVQIFVFLYKIKCVFSKFPKMTRNKIQFLVKTLWNIRKHNQS